MRILHVIAQLPALTGSGVYFTKVIGEMKKEAVEQAALFGSYPGFEWDVIEDVYKVRFEEELNFPIVGMSDIMPYKSTRYGDMTLNQFHYWKKAFHKEFQRAVEEFKPDVVLTHHTWILSSLVAKEFEGPVFAFCHNTDLRQMQLNPHFAKEVIDLQNVQGVFTSGKSEHEPLIHDFHISEEKLYPLGGAYDPAVFFPRERKANEKTRYIYAGKLSDAKGTPELIDAFLLLQKELENVELTLIGEPMGDNAERILEKIKQSKDIHLYPLVTQQELGELLREHDVFILPSYFEGMPLSPIEALACGISVIMTDNENLRDLVGEWIVNCGWIDFLEMPKLSGVDQIAEESKEDFILRLKESMIRQRRWKDEKQSDTIRKEIESHSWTGLVRRVLEIVRKEG